MKRKWTAFRLEYRAYIQKWKTANNKGLVHFPSTSDMFFRMSLEIFFNFPVVNKSHGKRLKPKMNWSWYTLCLCRLDRISSILSTAVQLSCAFCYMQKSTCSKYGCSWCHIYHVHHLSLAYKHAIIWLFALSTSTAEADVEWRRRYFVTNQSPGQTNPWHGDDDATQKVRESSK